MMMAGDLGYLTFGYDDGWRLGLPVQLAVMMAGELGYLYSWLW
jgi:hypothetical protein